MIIKCIYLRDTLKKYIKNTIYRCVLICVGFLAKGSPFRMTILGFSACECFSQGNGIYFNITTVCYGQRIQHYNNCL